MILYDCMGIADIDPFLFLGPVVDTYNPEISVVNKIKSQPVSGMLITIVDPNVFKV